MPITVAAMLCASAASAAPRLTWRLGVSEVVPLGGGYEGARFGDLGPDPARVLTGERGGWLALPGLRDAWTVEDPSALDWSLGYRLDARGVLATGLAWGAPCTAALFGAPEVCSAGTSVIVGEGLQEILDLRGLVTHDVHGFRLGAGVAFWGGAWVVDKQRFPEDRIPLEPVTTWGPAVGASLTSEQLEADFQLSLQRGFEFVGDELIFLAHRASLSSRVTWWASEHVGLFARAGWHALVSPGLAQGAPEDAPPFHALTGFAGVTIRSDAAPELASPAPPLRPGRRALWGFGLRATSPLTFGPIPRQTIGLALEERALVLHDDLEGSGWGYAVALDGLPTSAAVALGACAVDAATVLRHQHILGLLGTCINALTALDARGVGGSVAVLRSVGPFALGVGLGGAVFRPRPFAAPEGEKYFVVSLPIGAGVGPEVVAAFAAGERLTAVLRAGVRASGVVQLSSFEAFPTGVLDLTTSWALTRRLSAYVATGATLHGATRFSDPRSPASVAVDASAGLLLRLGGTGVGS